MYQLVWNNLGLVDVDSSRGQALLVRTKKEKALFFYEKMRFFSSPFIFFVAFHVSLPSVCHRWSLPSAQRRGLVLFGAAWPGRG